MRKNLHDKILKEKSKEQHLSTVSRKVLYQEEGGKKIKIKNRKSTTKFIGEQKRIFYISQWLKEHRNKN